MIVGHLGKRGVTCYANVWMGAAECCVLVTSMKTFPRERKEKQQCSTAYVTIGSLVGLLGKWNKTFFFTAIFVKLNFCFLHSQLEEKTRYSLIYRLMTFLRYKGETSSTHFHKRKSLNFVFERQCVYSLLQNIKSSQKFKKKKKVNFFLKKQQSIMIWRGKKRKKNIYFNCYGQRWRKKKITTYGNERKNKANTNLLSCSFSLSLFSSY